MKIATIGLAAALSFGLGGAAMAAPPAGLAPTGISGSGWNVMDLEGLRGWYVDKLGMKLLRTYARDGKAYEHILGYDGPPGGAILALLASPQRKPGSNAMSRIILVVPDAKALAAHLAKEGVASREVVPGVAYFIADPEGNPVELYTPPAK